MKSFLNGRIVLHRGDCLAVMAGLPENSVDAIVCDPPYALVSIQKRFGKSGVTEAQYGRDGLYKRASAGFMGKSWDTGETAFSVECWAQALRILKPGGHVVAFGGTRSYHRLASAIEDAGFEIRDQIGWAYGSGFPKSHNAGNGWGTALKPAWEPICLARKPLIGTVAENVLAHGTGALNVDGCRVESGGEHMRGAVKGTANGALSGIRGKKDFVATDSPLGRWPANLVHDGSAEVLAAFPDSAGQQGDVRGSEPSVPLGGAVFGDGMARLPAAKRNDSGSAARFFYSAKADSSDRIGSRHPTVKPVDLMQWLVRLVTPRGGMVLDPFAGTGTTGEAAFREGFSAILIERETEYCADIERRMALCLAGRDERARATIKEKLKDKPLDAGPLFAGDAA